MTVPGIDTAGDGGLLGLALSPTYLEDGLVYAYMSTATDNRVVRFPIGGTPNPVFTGIPRGAVHNGGGAGLRRRRQPASSAPATPATPRWRADPASLAGQGAAHRRLRRARSAAAPVFSRGHRDVTALCPAGEDAELLRRRRRRDDGPDELDTADRRGATTPAAPARWPRCPAEEGGLGGCAVAGGAVFLGALDGERVHVAAARRGRRGRRRPRGVPRRAVRPAAHRRPRRRGRAVDHHVQPGRHRHPGRGRRQGAADPAAVGRRQLPAVDARGPEPAAGAVRRLSSRDVHLTRSVRAVRSAAPRASA